MKKPIPKKKGRPVNPNLVPTVSVSIRLTEELLEKLDKISSDEGRSRTKQIEIIVKQFVEKYKS
ncbi:ribbon-helix-helix domain-containing protein [Leptospira sp. 2 VSF19]|uniref:Ribbon-helix-helix domain-containing protein n=1 Tax=Leptospira soteropolitanensis TaxID=2950025 RepID=A0AAW5VF43_9LEPT|nr:ribbon-helix-helix domain-containing protein [Leptospira soteropolitanensis]MCW7491972.1 ribbon-helix-helix domain-containing protein [Leptospira soteropolitanensis]MCW7499555.1 ribbon-helix-helix domain-containing protein [Leptospira soteropolitanensis]MCW7521806.1 ribbon-helix-helix domain-containing protein [Leptospira soteropolitanensis]MCW7525659.1 ribbon-helix-helix domain-containing protein [Leptospira soteropolitanensis]MCW7530226.1 ribbon-helix-helix domain-containing protein [Lept